MTSRSLGRIRRAARLLAAFAAVVSLVGLTACASSGAKSADPGGTGSGPSSGDGESGAGGSPDVSADVPADTSVDDPVVEDTTPTTPPGPPMSSCRSVVHIGDSTSIGLMSPAYLPEPGERIDAQYARVGVTSTRAEISGGRSIVEHLRNQLNAEDVARQVKATGYHGCWVLALGTTDAADIAAGSNHSQDERIDRMMAVIGDDPVLWVNVKTLETSGHWADANMQLFDQHLAAAEGRYPNLHVYDWSSVVQDPWFTRDRIHYTSSGYVQRSRLIADALAARIPATS